MKIAEPATFRLWCPRCRWETEHGYYTTGGCRIPQCGACDALHDGRGNYYGRAGLRGDL